MSNLIFHHGKDHLVVDFKRKIFLPVEKIIMLEGLTNVVIQNL
jgi:hypothetical protein